MSTTEAAPYLPDISGAGHDSGFARSHSPPLSLTGRALVVLAAAVWTTLVGALAVWRHDQFLSHRYDLGNIVQAVWSTTQGRPLEMTDGTAEEQIVRLAAHVDPILVLFSPLWWIHPAPETLIVAYAAVLAAGVYPVVRLALEHTGSRAVAALLGAWYLVLPWTVWIALNELNPVSLALPLLLYAIWFLDEHRLWTFALFAALAMLSGELIGLTVAALGVWYAIRRGRRRAGLVIAGVGAAWTALCLAVIIPAFNDGGSSRYYGWFDDVGGSPLGLLETLFTDPGTVLAEMTSRGDLEYIAWLAAPTALLFLAHPVLLIAVVPALGVNLLAEIPSSVSPLYHYSAPLIAILVAASIMGVGRVPERARIAVAVVPLGLSIVLLAAIGPTPGREAYLFPAREPAGRTAAMREAIGLVPDAVPVSVTNRLGAHLSARRVVHLFPAQDEAEWAVLDTRDPSNTTASWIGPTPFPVLLRRLDLDPTWQMVFESEGVRVYRRLS
jgi:uncharacterized membrane protein